MTMISRVGRKSGRTRALIAGLYLALGLGGLTMIYPFLLLMAGSTKTGVDIKDVSWLPAFLVDDHALYRKHVEALFNEQLDVMRAVYDLDVPSFEQVDPPNVEGHALVREWRSFIAGDLPVQAWTIGYMHAPVSRTVPQLLRAFKQKLMDRFAGNLDRANLELESEFTGWNAFFLLPEDAYLRRSSPLDSPLGEAWREFRASIPEAYRYYFSLEGFYNSLYLKTQYTRDIGEYNRIHGTTHASYDQVHLSSRYPETGTAREREDWETFVRDSLNLAWVRVDEAAAGAYQQYLQANYLTVSNLNHHYETSWKEWSEVPLMQEVPWSGLARSDWEAFLAGWVDPDTGERFRPEACDLYIASIEDDFRAYLRGRWPTLSEVNTALGTTFGSWQDICPPQREAHYLDYLERRGEIRRHFITRNFLAALDHLAFHGRGIRNTVIYCLLAVLAALLVNPLAAYAMSRYKPASTYKLLLFLLLTMAFPPMVTQIPVFLMMRDLNLLNTFAALLLPGLAHGYSIFLLKGFFDALPRDLYESAAIDGAGEWTMFWQITMSLSKPILAVVALQAFTTAYSNFMFALLICQDEKMWTMMVWLYQLQMRSGPGVVYASLLIAAIPTLIIFIFCQNIILRGIVIPVEK